MITKTFLPQFFRTGKKHSFCLLIILLMTSCSSYENFKNVSEDLEIPSQVYKADYNKVWQEVIKLTSQYEREVYNQEAGIIKTRWKDNTLELNFSDSFGTNDAVKAAQFKLVINVVKGYKGTKEVTKVSVFKRQRVEQDFLQGWKVLRSDGILEKSFLYRIERALAIENKLQEIEDKKAKEAEKNF
jgi:DNA polymerase III delta prime subunit